jgi:hypothetical protein
MAHILTGDWRTFVVKNGTPTNDDPFKLVLNDDGEFQAGTSHGGKPITGGASKANAIAHHIQIRRDEAPKRRYRGFLLVNGPQLVIVGVANLNPAADADGLAGMSSDEIADFFDQQQEVWIATKP